MEDDYSLKEDDFGNSLLMRSETIGEGQMNSFASGCQRVPLTEDIRRRLKIYEQVRPTFLRMYDELENVDELWLFDTQSNIALGRIGYRFSEYIIPGMDALSLYELGLTFYDWFKYSDTPQNPDRKALWSPMAFIEMFNQWIMHLQVSVFENRYSEKETFIGIIGAHLNLDWLMMHTIAHSTLRMMIVKDDDATLIGMNDAAKKDILLESFDISRYSYDTVFDPEVIAGKKRFVFETLKLDFGKSDEVTDFSNRLKCEFRFRQTLFGKPYTVIREKAPGIGFSFIALLDEPQ